MLDQLERDLIEELKDIEFAKSYGSECAKSEYGLVLFHARQAANLTQKELADKLGVKQPYIAQVESGETNPTLDALGRMLAVLGLKIIMNTEPIAPQEAVPVKVCAGKKFGVALSPNC
jgi:ribosome-binding protein aMBF1 (putative translation factor)